MKVGGMGRLGDSGGDGIIISKGDIGDAGDVGGASGGCLGTVGARTRFQALWIIVGPPW